MKRHSRVVRHSPLALVIKGLLTSLLCVVTLFGCSGDETTYVSPTTTITPTPITPTETVAVYRDSTGGLVKINSSDLKSGNFVFYAWLRDDTGGIDPSKLTADPASDPGKPLPAEQAETAPSFTQNLAAAYVGFKDTAGVVHPVIGAEVRWNIDQTYTGRVNSMQFGTSDDNSTIGLGINNDQADTLTNNKSLPGAGFPFTVNDNPLYNVTGIATPFVDGFTWVTLFSPDKLASGRIVAVATVNGQEIAKQIIFKDFSPVPKLEITKTVSTATVNLVNGTGTATWTITVKNVGDGDATNVDLNDILASGAGASYTLSDLPAGSTAVGDGFTTSFALAAGATVTLSPKATVTAAGTYCNEGQILTYKNAAKTWTPVDLKAQACFTAVEPVLSIVKNFVAADGTTSLGKAVTVAANESANLRIQVINSGSGVATAVAVSDALTSGILANYTLTSVSPSITIVGGGFSNYSLGNLAAGASATPLLFTVKASADGEYCDTATITGGPNDRACLTVATPRLTITKANAPTSVMPGNTYTSTIVVKNEGTATARNVVISDLLGLNSANNVSATYVSSSLNGTSGTLTGQTVTATTVDIAAGGSITFTVVSRIPSGSASGDYCDTATATSSNAATVNDTKCINVPAFSALQTQLVDLSDPVQAGTSLTYSTVLYVEALSNEGVNNNVITYIFGHLNAIDLVTPGVFDVTATRVYLDTAPVRDPNTGLVISNYTSPTAVLQIVGTNYTITTDPTLGKQVITMSPTVELKPTYALYIEQDVLVPGATANGMYTTSYIWDSKGTGTTPQHVYQASSSEPTTVTQSQSVPQKR